MEGNRVVQAVQCTLFSIALPFLWTREAGEERVLGWFATASSWVLAASIYCSYQFPAKLLWELHDQMHKASPPQYLKLPRCFCKGISNFSPILPWSPIMQDYSSCSRKILYLARRACLLYQLFPMLAKPLFSLISTAWMLQALKSRFESLWLRVELKQGRGSSAVGGQGWGLVQGSSVLPPLETCGHHEFPLL